MPKCPELSVLVKILAGENSFEVTKKSACIIQLLKRPTEKPITFNFDFWLNLS